MCKQATIALPGHQALSRLAADDPQAFELLCKAAIEDCIASAPDRIQPHLRRLQFRVDGIRRRSRSHLGALIKIQALMWESFLEMDQELKNFAHAGDSRPGAAKSSAAAFPRRSARVIDLQTRAPRKAG